ncbi:hypothetical protein QBE52_11300 [Clostridiaceae bacterium 35-E11]
MINKVVKQVVITSVIEGGRRTICENQNNIIENSMDVIFEKGDKAIDDFFDPLIRIGGIIDDIFGW